MHYAAALSDSDANSPLSSASCGGSGGGGGGAMMNGFPDQLFQQQHQAMMPHKLVCTVFRMLIYYEVKCVIDFYFLRLYCSAMLFALLVSAVYIA